MHFKLYCLNSAFIIDILVYRVFISGEVNEAMSLGKHVMQKFAEKRVPNHLIF